MNRLVALIAALVVGVACTAAYALYGVIDKGTWPESWPVELEPLRKHSRTLEGPLAPNQHFAIRFTDRQQFEAAWPHLLKVKTEGAPVFLIRGENFFLGEGAKAGVVVHAPPRGQKDKPETPEGPIDGVKDARMRWMNGTYIDLIVDGEIIDLNRIPLPRDTSIVDQRFEEKAKK